jgi:hypothetical protein
MKDLVLAILGLLTFGFIVYGVYYLGKNISYSLFYEDMVTQTITENVKMECLK